MQVDDYINAAKALLAKGEYSDGCTTPGSAWIHKHISDSKLICAAHDFGSRGLIEGVKPGLANNIMFLRANFARGNYIWGIIAFIATLPYAIVRYNVGMNIGVVPFHVLLVLLISFTIWAYHLPSKIPTQTQHIKSHLITTENNHG